MRSSQHNIFRNVRPSHPRRNPNLCQIQGWRIITPITCHDSVGSPPAHSQHYPRIASGDDERRP